MRSTNIIIFLICLNAAAVVTGAALGPQLGVQPSVGGDAKIDDANANITDETRDTNAGALSGTLLGFVTVAGDVVSAIDTVIFAGPNMFISLGAPALLVDPFKVLVAFVFGFDVAEVLSGRILS